MLTFCILQEMETGFSLLMYDSTATEQQLDNAHQMKGDGQGNFKNAINK